MEMKIGAAYVRVSTDGQLDLSPDAQKREILKYAKANGIIVPEEFIFSRELRYLRKEGQPSAGIPADDRHSTPETGSFRGGACMEVFPLRPEPG